MAHDFNIDVLAERLERGVAEILAREATRTAAQIRSRTPQHRGRTRSGVFGRSRQTKATIGIRFDQHYPGNTPTRQRFRSQWRTLRPIVRARILQQLNEVLKGT